jgi:hypothetical protein
VWIYMHTQTHDEACVAVSFCSRARGHASLAVLLMHMAICMRGILQRLAPFSVHRVIIMTCVVSRATWLRLRVGVRGVHTAPHRTCTTYTATIRGPVELNQKNPVTFSLNVFGCILFACYKVHVTD